MMGELGNSRCAWRATIVGASRTLRRPPQINCLIDSRQLLKSSLYSLDDVRLVAMREQAIWGPGLYATCPHSEQRCSTNCKNQTPHTGFLQTVQNLASIRPAAHALQSVNNPQTRRSWRRPEPVPGPYREGSTDRSRIVPASLPHAAMLPDARPLLIIGAIASVLNQVRTSIQ